MKNPEEFTRLVERLMQKHKVPGVQVGIMVNNEIEAFGFGVTNIEHPLKVTGKTLFQIGSISKTFTATAVMRLVEMGRIDLDATVRTYIPDFRVQDKEASERATVRDLLTHTGGWFGDFFHDTGPGDDAMKKYAADMSRLEQLSPLGALWSYNNAGFYLAGYVIEVVTGKKYEDVLKELIFDPLGLSHCFFDPGKMMTYPVAVGHTVEDGEIVIDHPWALPRAIYPAGGINSNVRDLMVYARFHMGDGTTESGEMLLQKATMEQMQSAQISIHGDKHVMGLSWFIKEINSVKNLYHWGSTVGQTALFWMVPGHDLAFAILTNNGTTDVLIDQIGRWILKTYLDICDEIPKPINAPVETLTQYAGMYSQPYADIELGILGGKIVAAKRLKAGFPSLDAEIGPSPQPWTMDLCEQDRLIGLDGDAKDVIFDIIRKPDGTIGWLSDGYRVHKRLG